TGAESDAFGPLAEVHEFGSRHRRGDGGHVVVLRDPVTSETELVRFVDDLLRGGKGVCGRLSRANRHEVKDGKLHTEATAGVTGSFLACPGWAPAAAGRAPAAAGPASAGAPHQGERRPQDARR